MGRFVLRVPRSDTNEVGEYEVSVTAELHGQAERTKKEKREEKHPVEAQTKTQNQRIVLKHVGAPLVAESWVGRRPECTG